MPGGHREQRGFALLVLLGVIGAGSLALVLALQSFVPSLADIAPRVQGNLTTIERATAEACQRNGAFPADLDALAGTSGLPVAGGWRVDPWGRGQDIDYQLAGNGPRLRSRGRDGVLGSGDDTVLTVDAETLLRTRQNARLRLLRALHLRALQAAVDAVPGTAPVTATALRDAIRTLAQARRQYWFATPAARALLTVQMATATATVAQAMAWAGWVLPPALTGAGGLLQGLGVPDTRGVDGFGLPLLLDPALGVAAAGHDGIPGTADDS